MDIKELNAVELLEELGDATPASMKAYSRDELRTIARRLGLEVGKKRKADLITDILEAIADYQETVKKSEMFDQAVPEVTEYEKEHWSQLVNEIDIQEGANLGQIGKEAYESFRTICQKLYVDGKWQPLSVEIADLANQVGARLEAKGSQSTTLISYRSKVLDVMAKLLETERDQFYFEQFWVYLTGHSYADRLRKPRGQGTTCLPCFAKSLFSIWKYTHAVKKMEVDVVNKEKKELVYKGVNITNLLNWAYETLQRVIDVKPGRKAWRGVSVALALATGRRQVEIHSCGRFEYVDEYHVKFTGQAKTRLNALAAYEENPSYIIPTLVPAHLVIAGHNWLKEVSGKHYETKEQVNDNVARDVGKFVKEVVKATVSFYDSEGNLLESEADEFKYHDLRELYALASYECEGKIRFKQSQAHKWVNEVLGEDRGNTGAPTTAMRYLDEYNLVSESLARV